MPTPKNTEEAAAFLRAAKDGPLKWKQMCLSLQRQARGLPVVYPSALSAALATPLTERVTRQEDLKRGMVAYSDDANDSNPFAHIYFIAGRDEKGRILTWTNDLVRVGGVDVVPIEAYKDQWGDKFLFGATWLNGFNFSEFDKPPVGTRGSLGDNYLHAIDDVERVISFHKKRGHNVVVRRLERDLEVMKKRLKQHK